MKRRKGEMMFEPYVAIKLDRTSQATLLERITKVLGVDLSEYTKENAEYAKREIIERVESELIEAFELGMRYAQGRNK